MITLERIYGETPPYHGYRVLVDRMWPRGISKEEAHLDEWMKEVGPSKDLIEGFHHGEISWDDFKKQYWIELNHKPDLIGRLKDLARKDGVVLLYGSKDVEHNQAVVLKEYLTTHS